MGSCTAAIGVGTFTASPPDSQADRSACRITVQSIYLTLPNLPRTEGIQGIVLAAASGTLARGADTASAVTLRLRAGKDPCISSMHG